MEEDQQFGRSALGHERIVGQGGVTIAEVRDVALIAGAISLGVLGVGWLLAVAIAGRIGWRALRRLQRLHDGQVGAFLERLDGWARAATLEDGRVDWAGIARAAMDARGRWQERRRPKRRRLFGLLPPKRARGA